jgi:hypothetical protein
MIPITGNTYGVRDRLKAMGCRWNAAAKRWEAPCEKIAEQAQAIVPASKGGGNRGPRTCKTCGCRINYGVYCGKCEYR